MPIYFYSTVDEYGCFSNFSPHGVAMHDGYWPTVEHYFQAQKFADTDHKERIRNAAGPKQAKTLGRSRTLPIRADWEEVKENIMRDALRQKFKGHADIQAVLLATGAEELIEKAPTDYYWGCGKSGTGKNRLGVLLMEVRAELQVKDRPLASLVVEPVGFVRGGRLEAEDDDWGEVEAVIELDSRFSPDALTGLQEFSHLVIVYHFHQANPDEIETASRYPRGNTVWPKVGIFAQRGRNRPNLLGVSVCRLIKVDGRQIRVQGLDAIDGTPVLDIKPYMTGFAPQGDVMEPRWAKEIMAAYWTDTLSMR